MKKKFVYLILLLGLLLTPIWVVQAQKTEDTTPTKTPTETEDKIQELKDRVANRVAALKKEKFTPITGLVKSATDAALILTKDDQEFSIQLDEDGKVYSIDTNLKKKETKLSTLAKDSYISIIGTLNEDEKTAIAKVIVSKKPNLSLSGTVSSVSTKDGTITITDENEKTYILDIEVTTKINSYNPEKDNLVKTGLSKIEEGARINVYGVAGEENKIQALRVLVLPVDLFSSKTSEETPTPKVTVKPTETSSENQ